MNKALGITLLVIAIVMLVFGEILSFNSSKLEVSFKNIDKPYTIRIKKNSYLKRPDNPTRTGYKFIGWYRENKLFDFNLKLTESIVLEARWEKASDIKDSSKQVIGNSLFEIVREILNFN